MNATTKTVAQLVTDLNRELYAAAAKAGMEPALRAAQVEVDGFFNSRGVREFYVAYEAEVAERGVQIDYTAIKRAKVWLAKRVAGL